MAQDSLTNGTSYLIERARDVSITLEPFVPRVGNTPFEKAMLYLLQHQNENGAWGSIEYLPWTTVNTGYMIQLLSAFGFHHKSTWHISRADSPTSYFGGVEKAISYVLSSQQPNGRWGEDFYDTCQIVKALLPFRAKLPQLEDPIARGLGYIRGQIRDDFSNEKHEEWYGPGFFAAATEIFTILGETDLADELLEQLYQRQDDVGCFCKRDLSTQIESIDLCVWHTCWAILTMHILGIPSDARRLELAIQWLTNCQNGDGSWGVALKRQRPVFTSYGVMALTVIRGKDFEAVKNGCEWLIRQQTENGRIGELESTIHAALAFSKLFPRLLTTSIPLKILLDAQHLLDAQSQTLVQQKQQLAHLRDVELNLTEQSTKAEELSRRLEELTKEVAVWKHRWDDHPIKISNRFLAVSGWIVGIFSCLLTIIAPAFDMPRKL